MSATDNQPLVADESENVLEDHDSGHDEEVESSTQSISSSILQYRQENGRTYHGYKDGKYNVPNDEEENERLDLQHALFLRTFDDRLGFAPPCKPGANVQHVLDVGTGTGIWVMDYADDHPGAEVIGVDLSPIQPSFVPPNVRFIIDDVEEEWQYSSKFDYIHSRMMNSSVADWESYATKIFENLEPGGYFLDPANSISVPPNVRFIIDDVEEEWQYSSKFDYIHSRMMNSSVADWESYATKIFENLEPGGYVELQEIDVFTKSDDNTLTPQHNLWQWAQLIYDASVKLGRPYFDPGNIKDVLTKVGFEEVTEAKFKWPTNRWPKDKKHKELGVWNNENANFFLEAVAIAPLTRALGWSKEEVTVFIAQARKELNDPRIHAYWPIISVYGRKPAKYL